MSERNDGLKWNRAKPINYNRTELKNDFIIRLKLKTPEENYKEYSGRPQLSLAATRLNVNEIKIKMVLF